MHTTTNHPPFNLTDPTCPFAAAIAPQAARFAHENPTDELSAAALAYNRAFLTLAAGCGCERTADITAHCEGCAMRIGSTPGRATGLLYIALMLTALPRLAYVIDHRGHLRPEHLRTIADAIAPILECDTPEPNTDSEDLPDPQQILNKLEPLILTAILPRIDGQKMISDRTLFKRMQQTIEVVNDYLRPPDTTPEVDAERIVISDDGHRTGYLSARMGRDKAAELTAAIDAVTAKEKCSEVDALLHLVRGSTQVEVTLNLYCHLNGGPMWSVDTGWLSQTASAAWLERVDKIRIVSDSAAAGYRPTDAQVAFVVGRDGVCMFPGCEVPADQCQLDHIVPYNHADPSTGGPTDTENLHALCQRHHNVKTDGHFEVIRFSDGTERWCSVATGAQASSRSVGPANAPGRVSVSARLRRKSRSVREHNHRRCSQNSEPSAEEEERSWGEGLRSSEPESKDPPADGGSADDRQGGQD